MSLFIVVTLLASNFAGTWAGTMKTENITDSAFMILTQDGARISGTIGPDQQGQFKITKASIENETLIVEAQPGATLRFVMKINGDNLSGDVFENGEPIGTIKFERVRH
jgi:hypothetical protein